ncbi:hypothetical protein [Phenylobacterium sp.]|uniref:hypothetical protein n=1 Tax=Phenylobacterium sp. TaxID=1871053 RepID=UPI001212CA86|nr:hypothetical protein [Phenylobacterium sp.]THD72493.1 MAG: hypothetical protein E8A12_00725 [Phenylobacterium sp.]
MKIQLTYAAAMLAASMILSGQAMAQAGLQPTPPTSTPLTAPPSAAPLPQAQAPMPGQPSAATPPVSSATAPTGAGADTSARAAGGASLMTGMSVKDNTGALIGEVSGLKNGVATIKMGADTFTVDSDKLGVSNGVANINASQAELKKMLPPKK